MGQKAHPKSLRLAAKVVDFDSTWMPGKIDEYAEYVEEDHKVRQYLEKKLSTALLSRIEIHRKAQKLTIFVITGRPGVVVGRGGQGLDSLRKSLQKLTGRKDIQIDVLEVNKPDADANLIAQNIASQLKNRVAYKRVVKQAIQRSMRSGILGIKIRVSGRLGGAEIARSEWAKEGRIPNQTFRANIEHSIVKVPTVFGIIGVQVSVFTAEVLEGKAEKNIKYKNSNQDRMGGLAGQGARRQRAR
ncbi:MAG: 30S ribosomal protein S3 [Cyanobacteria bacterium P01_H01_bin.74]